jgi:hypothetical protein
MVYGGYNCWISKPTYKWGASPVMELEFHGISFAKPQLLWASVALFAEASRLSHLRPKSHAASQGG